MAKRSRRDFLKGGAALAAAVAMPAIPAAAVPSFCVYQGIIVRDVVRFDLREASRAGLRDWYSNRYSAKFFGEVIGGDDGCG